MPKIIKDNQIIDDNWQVLPADASASDIPASGPVFVPLSLWIEQKGSLTERTDAAAPYLTGGEEPAQIADDISALPAIAIEFTKFADGRGYSYARELRTRFNFNGEIRAIGDVLQDQLFYMHRCGFNAFDLAEGRDLTEALNGLKDFTVTYQADALDPRPLFAR